MTLCPVALAIGCRKCPIFSVCPLKSVIGDQAPETEKPEAGTKSKGETPGTPAKRKRGARKGR
jgi:hypothetical protein